MRKVIAICLVLLVGILAGSQIHARAQSNVMYFQPVAGTTVASCGTPAAGSGSPLCGTAAGWFIWNGTAWQQIGATQASGVTSVTVNGVQQTGAVVLSIPTKAVIPATQATTVPLQ